MAHDVLLHDWPSLPDGSLRTVGVTILRRSWPAFCLSKAFRSSNSYPVTQKTTPSLLILSMFTPCKRVQIHLSNSFHRVRRRARGWERT